MDISDSAGTEFLIEGHAYSRKGSDSKYYPFCWALCIAGDLEEVVYYEYNGQSACSWVATVHLRNSGESFIQWNGPQDKEFLRDFLRTSEIDIRYDPIFLHPELLHLISCRQRV